MQGVQRNEIVDPYRAVASRQYRANVAVTEPFVHGIRVGNDITEPVDAHLCRDPDVAFPVLENRIDRIVRKSFGFRIVIYLRAAHAVNAIRFRADPERTSGVAQNYGCGNPIGIEAACLERLDAPIARAGESGAVSGLIQRYQQGAVRVEKEALKTAIFA